MNPRFFLFHYCSFLFFENITFIFTNRIVVAPRFKGEYFNLINGIFVFVLIELLHLGHFFIKAILKCYFYIGITNLVKHRPSGFFQLIKLLLLLLHLKVMLCITFVAIEHSFEDEYFQ